MKNWFRRRDRAREIHEEVESHLAMRAELNRASGMAPADAQTGARRQFGNAALIEEDMRRVRAIPWLESLAQDVRYALRGLRRSPVFTATAVLTIALGIGRLHRGLQSGGPDPLSLRCLTQHAERLVSIGMMAPSMDKLEFMMADGYVRLRDHQTPFSRMTSFGFISDCDLSEQNAVRMRCAMVESTFLPTFGIQPALGRNAPPAEDQPNASKVALVSYAFWKKLLRRRYRGHRPPDFGGRPAYQHHRSAAARVRIVQSQPHRSADPRSHQRGPSRQRPRPSAPPRGCVPE